MNKIKYIYKTLLKEYGKQNWWPTILSLDKEGLSLPKKLTQSVCVYDNKNYSYPKTEKQKFEICLGAILTQGTNWVAVEKSLINLSKLNVINPNKILRINEEQLKEAIKPSGYYNQKAKYIVEFTNFFIKLNARTPTREELLSVKGIGKETADSILLYAYKQPVFVIDAYTRKLFGFSKNIEYDKIRIKFEKALPKDYRIYNEYHALIVAKGKSNKNLFAKQTKGNL